jgi:hypothetical protein
MLFKTASTVLCLLAFLMSTRGDLVVKYLVEIQGERNHFILKLKEGKTRIDFTDWSLLIDRTSNKVSLLSHSDKAYSDITGVAMLRRLQSYPLITARGTGQPGGTDFKPTGVTQTINNYECQEFAGNILGFQITLFLASDSSLQQKLDKAVHNSYSGPTFNELRELVGGLAEVSGVPIRFVFEGAVLKFAGTFESMQETDLDDFEFTIPPDYAKRAEFGL